MRKKINTIMEEKNIFFIEIIFSDSFFSQQNIFLLTYSSLNKKQQQ